MSNPIRIILADDHAIVRKGIVQILKEGFNHPQITETGDAESLYAAVLKEEFDLAILDISLPGRSGLDILPDIKAARPSLPVLMVSINPVEHYGIRALKKGAAGYLMKDAAPAELLTAINQILKGKKYISTALGEKLIETLNAPSHAQPHEALSDRELEVFKSLAGGMGVKDIAERLSLSVTTVSTYRARILEKMNFSINADIVRYALDKGLV